MRQLFPWTGRAQRRQAALAEAAALQRIEYEEAVGRLKVCPACPADAARVPAARIAEHFETDHAALMNDPVC